MATSPVALGGERLALPLGLLVTVLAVAYAVGHPDLLHIDVHVTPAVIVAALLGLSLAVLILRRGDVALAVLVGAVYLNLSHVLVRQGWPSLLQLVAVPLVLAALASRSVVEWRRLVRQPLTWMLAAYTLVLLASSVYARAPGLADQRVAEAIKALVIYGLVVLLASSARRIRLAAWTMVLSGALLAALGLLRAAGLALPSLSAGLARMELAHIYGTVFEPRITGPLGDANFFAQILLILVPVGLCLTRDSGTGWRRLPGYACVALIMAATVLTYSRGGALALAGVTALALVAHGIGWKRLAVGGLALGMAAAVALPAEFTARLSTIRQLLPGGTPVLHFDSSFEERLLLTGTAWRMFADNPVLGVGAGNYAARFDEYAIEVGSSAPDYHDEGAPRYPHNLFLEVGAETGLPGVLTFGGVLLAAFLGLGRARRLPSTDVNAPVRGLALAFQIALVGYLVSSLFLHGDFQRYLWLLFGMAGAVDAVVGPRPRRLRAGAMSPPSQETEGAGREMPAAAQSRPVARRGIGVLLSRFPSVTETFILREVIEMERQGQPVRLMPLLRESPPVVHREAEAWIDRALFTPFVSWPIVRANLRALARHPWRYVSTIVRLVGGTLHSPRVCLGTMAIIPKAIYLAERARAEGIGHVHAHFATHPTTVALVMATFADVSYSMTIHAHDLFSRRYRPLLERKVRTAAFVRVISRYNLEHLRVLAPDLALDHVHVIHVGIESDLYAGNASAAPDENGRAAPSGPVRLLTVAALRDYKGLPVLIEACRRLRDEGLAVECEIVGEGPMRPPLESQIRALGLEDSVRLLGARPQDEVRRLLARRPLFVLPSIILPDGWMEGIPVALMEAMASGCAVVTSRLSGIPELVKDREGGLLVEPGDAVGLAAAIRELAATPALAHRLAKAGRARVEDRFRLDRTVAALLTLIDAHNVPVPADVEAAAARLGGNGARVGVGWMRSGTDATVTELLLPDETGRPRRAMLKLHHQLPTAPRTAAERAGTEWAVLQAMTGDRSEGNGSGQPLGVPRPLYASPEDGWLVMEACAGPSLAMLIRRTRYDRDTTRWAETLTAIRQAGEWLELFQQKSGLDGDSDAVFAAWEAALEADLERSARVIPGALRQAAFARMEDLVRQGGAHALPGVLHHGDFWPGNLLVGPDGLRVIDFEGARAGLQYEDAAYFLVHLELFLDYPLLGARRRQATAAFLEGYRHGAPLDDVAWRLARISKVLQVLARCTVVRGPRPAYWRRLAILRRMLAESAT